MYGVCLEAFLYGDTAVIRGYTRNGLYGEIYGDTTCITEACVTCNSLGLLHKKNWALPYFSDGIDGRRTSDFCDVSIGLC